MIQVSIEGFDVIQRTFQYLPQFARDKFAEEMGKYLVKELQEYEPPNRFVTRKAAYGKSFFTRRQQKWFFWALRTGRIRVPYVRTHELRRSWRLHGKGESVYIQNDRSGVPYVMGDIGQSRHERMVGWETVGQFVEKRTKTIETRGNQIITKTLRQLGWK